MPAVGPETWVSRSRGGSTGSSGHRGSSVPIFPSECCTSPRQRSEASEPPTFLAGDTLRLPFADGAFDGAAVAFGIRNVEDLDGGLRELTRVVRPGGRVVLLEFTPLRVPVFGPIFNFYLERVLPRLGNWISGSDEGAYSYLHDSIRRWPDGETLTERMRSAGICAIRWRSLFPGNVALHAGTRQ